MRACERKHRCGYSNHGPAEPKELALAGDAVGRELLSDACDSPQDQRHDGETKPEMLDPKCPPTVVNERD